MRLGVLVELRDKEIGRKIESVADMGFSSCQLCAWDHSLFTDEVAGIINAACSEYGVSISTFWCGWSGPAVWNFYEGRKRSASCRQSTANTE